jgi:3-deoxy-manno-octulosonate cytidylyltransferase (CMP-KDO synthetase)
LPVYSHIGLYAYTREFLLKYTKLPQTPLEAVEALEQLRVIENGYKIYVSLVNKKNFDVNTPEDLEKAQLIAKELLKNKQF